MVSFTLFSNVFKLLCRTIQGVIVHRKINIFSSNVMHRFLFQNTYGLLTKFFRSRCLDIDLVLFCEFMDLDSW